MFHTIPLQWASQAACHSKARDWGTVTSHASPAQVSLLMQKKYAILFISNAQNWLVGHRGGGNFKEALSEGPGPGWDPGDLAAFSSQPRPCRCVPPIILVPILCPGFDLPTQYGGALAAGVPGSFWPPGYSDCHQQADASHQPEKETHPQTKAQALPHSCR